MKISDLLRQIADELDQSGEEEEENMALSFGEVPDDGEDSEQKPMLSPLQQKHELLKKVSDVANNTDKFNGQNNEEEDHNEQGLDMIRQLAGLNTSCQEDESDVIKAAHFITDNHESD